MLTGRIFNFLKSRNEHLRVKKLKKTPKITIITKITKYFILYIVIFCNLLTSRIFNFLKSKNEHLRVQKTKKLKLKKTPKITIITKITKYFILRIVFLCNLVTGRIFNFWKSNNEHSRVSFTYRSDIHVAHANTRGDKWTNSKDTGTYTLDIAWIE